MCWHTELPGSPRDQILYIFSQYYVIKKGFVYKHESLVALKNLTHVFILQL